MKKLILLILIIFPLFITSCSSDDEDNNPYSEKQQKALTVMKGNFKDATFQSVSGTQISFIEKYDKPLKIYKNDYMNGNTILIEAQGVCVWSTHYAGGMSAYNDSIPCYYEVSYDASRFTLVYKNGEMDKTLYERFDLKVTSESTFQLQDKDLTLPYQFSKID